MNLLTLKKIFNGLVPWVLLILIWEALYQFRVLDGRFIPSASETFKTGIINLICGKYTSFLVYTLLIYATGLTIGSLVGFFLGLFIVTFQRVRIYIIPFIEFFRPMPSIALIPIVMLLLGVGVKTRIFLSSYGAMWPILISVIYGADNVDRELLEVAQNLNISRTNILFKMTLPVSMPYLLSGLKTSSGVALLVSVSTEMIVGGKGMGNLLLETQYSSNLPQMYSIVIILGMIGYFSNMLFSILETWLWKQFAPQTHCQKAHKSR